jgi:ubiquinone/menaquinone biosynthesis C-methylase UbiE
VTNATEFGRLSNWRDTVNLSASKAREQAARLEHRARAEDETSARDEYLRLLRISPGERVLDVGCGSGVVTREIAKRVAPGGAVVGVDPSAELLNVAREYADEAAVGGLVEFQEGDCRKLAFPDASFDVVVAATVLAHVPQAEKALPEMVRVVRAGGRVGVFDFDGDGLVIGHPDRTLTRRIVASHCDNGAVNGWLIREIPSIFSELGLKDVRTRGFMSLERGKGSFYADLAQRAAQAAAKAGAITAAELASWLAQLEAVLDKDRFIGGRLHIFVWGTK